VAIAATRSNGINGIPLETIYCALSAQPVNLVKPLRRKIMLNSTHPNITKYSGFILSPFGSVAHLLRAFTNAVARGKDNCPSTHRRSRGEKLRPTHIFGVSSSATKIEQAYFGAAIAGNFSKS